MRLLLTIFLCASCGFTLGAFAQTQEVVPLVTDRPDQTESANIVPVGGVQIEAGVAKDWNLELFNQKTNTSLAGALIRIGLHNKIEFRVQQYYLSEKLTIDASSLKSNNQNDPLVNDNADKIIRRSQGWSAFNVGAKVNLLEGDKWKPALALLYDVGIAGGSRTVSSGHNRHHMRVNISHAPGEWNIGYNIGNSYSQKEWGDLFYTVSVGRSLTEKLGAFIEAYGDLPLISDADGGPQAIDGGFTYLVSPLFQLDLYGGHGLNQFSPKWIFGAGFSLRLLK